MGRRLVVGQQTLDLYAKVRLLPPQPDNNEMKYTIIIEKGNESGYVAYAPALKGCVSQGKSKQEALGNIKEAIEAYIEALLEDGLPVPTEIGRDTIEIEVAAK